MTQILSIFGTGRQSGKTTTVESLISEFTKLGHKVGAIKQIHETDFSIDSPGKDTWRLANAGAKAVVAAAPKEISLIKPVNKDRFQEALELLKADKLDLIIVEGNPLKDVPKILATRGPEMAEEVISREKVLCISSLSPEKFVNNNFGLRVFNPTTEISDMAQYTLKQIKK